MHRIGLVFCVVLLSTAGFARAQLRALETEHLRLIYIYPTNEFLAPYVAQCFENSMRVQQRLFDYDAAEKVTVILSDFSDYGNAGAGAVPKNGLAVSIAPMSFAYETYPANERMNTLMNHELVHIVNFDRAAGVDHFFRTLFAGKVRSRADHPETVVYNYLTSPRSSAPRWFHEGIAVFVETWMAGGLGRAQGSYDEMVFRSMVADSTRFYDPLGLVAEGTKANFQIEMNSYLYGTRFMSYLAYEFSPSKLLEWVTRDGDSRAGYGRQFRHVFGEDLDDVWQQWIEFEHGFQAANLRRIAEYPITESSDVTSRSLGSISRAFVDEEAGQIYVGVNYPGSVAHIAAIGLEDGRMRELTEIKGPMMYAVTSLAFDPDGRRLFYTTDNSDYRDIVELDLRSGRKRMILEDARIGDLVYDRSDGSLWGVRHNDGICTVVRIPAPYDRWVRVFSLPYGEEAYDLDVAPDGKSLSYTHAAIDGEHEVRVVEMEPLLAGEQRVRLRFGFGSTIPMNFTFSDDGNLYGSSYLTGVSNVFRYNVAADSLEALSNTDTGFFRPTPLSDGRMLVFRYTGEGFRPAFTRPSVLTDINAIEFFGARIVEKWPELRQWRAARPSSVDIDSLTTRDAEYRGLASLQVDSLVPVVEGYKSSTAVGINLTASDPLSLHKFDLSASYSPTERLEADERLHLSAAYRRYDWSVDARYNAADFYDLVGPTRTSRKGYSLSLGYKRSLVYDMPRQLDFHANVSGYGGLERLPDYQNIAASFDRFLTVSTDLVYRNLRFSIGAVDYEKGWKAGLHFSDTHVNGTSYPLLRADLDGGVPLFAHSSLWLRTAAGYSPGDRDNSFANFYFGGFGNNWVDHRSSQRYREWYSLPGLELNALGGTNYVRALVDWNLPPLRFRRLGTPAAYASWMRTSLFASGVVTNLDDSAQRREVLSLGAQWGMRMTLLNHRDLTLSTGYAVALESGNEMLREFMISLKIF